MFSQGYQWFWGNITAYLHSMSCTTVKKRATLCIAVILSKRELIFNILSPSQLDALIYKKNACNIIHLTYKCFRTN